MIPIVALAISWSLTPAPLAFELSRSLLVIGGGYVAAELARMFARAGVKATLGPSRLLPQAEPEIGAALTGYFTDGRNRVVSGILNRAIRKIEKCIWLGITRHALDMTIDADRVLIARGARPNIEGLGLTEHGIDLSPRGGGIVVYDRMRT